MQFKLNPLKVVDNREIAPLVFVLSFLREFEFIPGQFIAVAVHPADQPRMYSIASGIHDNEVRILFNIKPGGELTPHLGQLKHGDTIYCSGPMGTFRVTPEPAVWIATGTGIAPFVSVWRSGRKDNIILIQGGRYLNSFYFSDEFAGIPVGNYIRCCSGEVAEGVYHGRITQWLAGRQDLPKNWKYYLCGSAEMVVETRDILITNGITFDNIIAEIYF